MSLTITNVDVASGDVTVTAEYVVPEVGVLPSVGVEYEIRLDPMAGADFPNNAVTDSALADPGDTLEITQTFSVDVQEAQEALVTVNVTTPDTATESQQITVGPGGGGSPLPGGGNLQRVAVLGVGAVAGFVALRRVMQ